MIPSRQHTQIGSLSLCSPIMPASGTFDPLSSLPPFDLEQLGAVVLKSITLHPQWGNAPPRLAETPSGLVNSIGIPNRGLTHFVTEVLPRYTQRWSHLVVSVAGYSPEEYGLLTKTLSRNPAVIAIELNLSCPNLSYHVIPAHDPVLLKESIHAARETTTKPLWAKLALGVPSLGKMATVAETAGADACTVINTISAMAIDQSTGTPLLGGGTGGLSGPAIKPIALAAVFEVAQHSTLPIIGVGGIMTLQDILDFLYAGASAVQIGTASFYDPLTMAHLVQELESYLDSVQCTVADLVGRTQKRPQTGPVERT